VETIHNYIQDAKEKAILLAFLDGLNYQYRAENNDAALTDEEIKHLLRRKADFLAGKTTSRSWEQIKQ
jgi:hypothetical protein